MIDNNEYQRGIAEGMKRERARWLANIRLSLELHAGVNEQPSKFGSPELQERIIAHAMAAELGTPTSNAVAPDYKGFALAILTQSRDHSGSDIDGGTVQDEATRHGLLVEVLAQQRCGDECQCAEYDDFPQTCFRYNPAVARSLEALSTEHSDSTCAGKAKAEHVQWREKGSHSGQTT